MILVRYSELGKLVLGKNINKPYGLFQISKKKKKQITA